MTLYSWPASILPSRFRLELIGNTQSGGKSPFDGTEQTLELPGARWAFDLFFEGLTAEEHRPLMAFIAKLRGRAGRFLWGPPFPRQATCGGSPAIHAAGLTGTLLQTEGWSGAGYSVVPGDWLCWPDPTGRMQLHIVTGDGDDAPNPSGPDLGGLSNFHVSPPIRRSPALHAPVYPVAPVGVFRLAEDRNGQDITRGLMAGGSLRIEEAIW